MNTTRWDYWDVDGAPRSGTAEAQGALEAAMRAEHDHPGANHLYIGSGLASERVCQGSDLSPFQRPK